MSCGDIGACGERDLVRSRAAWVIWFLPSALILVGVFWGSARPVLWIPSMVVMGAACLVNARRCGRLHCHITGPTFLLAALATFLDAVGALSLGWIWILLLSAAGLGIGYGLEQARGLYVARSARPLRVGEQPRDVNVLGVELVAAVLEAPCERVDQAP